MMQHPKHGLLACAARSLLLLFLLCTGVQAQPAKLAVPLVMDAARVYVAAELWYEQLGSPLPLFEAGVKLAVSGDAERVLADYYTAAKAGDLTTLISLYTEVDGSRGRVAELLQEIPNAFDGHQALVSAKLLSKGIWGPYQILSVELSDGSNPAPWPMVLYCDQGACGITDVVDGDTDDEQLLDLTLLVLATVHANPALWSYNDAVADTVGLGRVYQALPPLLPPGAGDYPLNIYFDLIQLDEFNAFTVIDQIPYQPRPEIQFLVDLTVELRAAEAQELDEIFSDRVHQYDQDTSQRMTESLPDPAGGLAVTSYVWPAFRDRVLSWVGIKVLGLADMGNGVLLFVQPLIENGSVDSLQMFTIGPFGDGGALRLVTEQDLGPPAIAMSLANVLTFVQSEYGSQPTLFAGQTFGIDRVFSAGFQSGAGGTGWVCATDAAHYAPATSAQRFVPAPEQSGGGYAGHYYAKAGTDAAEPWRCSMDAVQMAAAFGGANVGELYAEWYEYFSSDYPFASVQPLFEIGFRDGMFPQSAKSTRIQLDGHNGGLVVRHRCGEQDALLCDVELELAATSKMPMDRWVKLGLWVKANTPGESDGAIRLFLEDTQIAAANDMDLVGTDGRGYDSLSLGGRYDNEGLPLLRSGSRYLDSFTLFRSRQP